MRRAQEDLGGVVRLHELRLTKETYYIALP